MTDRHVKGTGGELLEVQLVKIDNELDNAIVEWDTLWERLTILRQLILTVLIRVLEPYYTRGALDAMLEPYDRIEREIREESQRRAHDRLGQSEGVGDRLPEHRHLELDHSNDSSQGV